MSSFSWLTFVQRYGIKYVTHGPNVGRNRANITCPFCGSADEGHHLGLDLLNPRWACFRDPAHRSGNPVRLIQALLRCTWMEAEEIAKEGAGQAVALDALKERIAALGGPKAAPKHVKVEYGPNELPLRPGRHTGRFLDYMEKKRRFGEDAEAVCAFYRLRCAVYGPHADRILIPIWGQEGLTGWTGRTLDPKAEARYKAHPGGEQVKFGMVNANKAEAGGHVLVVAEGPLDALKMDYYGQEAGVRCVAIMGTSATTAQITHLLELARSYDRIVVSLDPGYAQQALRLTSRLTLAGLIMNKPVDCAEDLGDLTPTQARQFAQTLLESTQ